jgi:hypothetical protein
VSGAGIFGIGLAAGLGYGAIRGTMLAAEGAALGAQGLALGAVAATRQWKDEAGRLRACREAEVLRQLVLAEVSARNARIAAVRGLGGTGPNQTSPAVAVPEPLEAGTTDTAALQAWCLATDVALAAAEDAAARQLAIDLVTRLTGRRMEARGLVRATPEPAGPGSAAAGPDPAAERTLLRVLTRLPADAAAEDRRGVADAAARVVAAATPGDARTCLDEVRLRVQRAGERSRARRAETVDAARMLHAVGQDSETAVGIRGELAEVVAGLRPFDADLRVRATAEVSAADAAADHRYVAELVLHTVAELGYTVDEGFETAAVADGVLRVGRADWDEHAVHLLVDPTSGQVRTALVRTAPGTDPAEEERTDAARERAWCAALQVARQRLEGAGVQTKVEHLTAPGTRVVPQVSRVRNARPARRTAERWRERRRP